MTLLTTNRMMASSLRLMPMIWLVLVGLAASQHVDSRYVHSNDTMRLVLSSRVSDVLRGPPGSLHKLEFVLTNTGNPGRFSIYASSEDNFMGRIDTTQTYLSNGQQQTISVHDMLVPQRPVGDKVSFTLTVERLDGFSKRSAEQDPNRPPATGGNYGQGSSGTYLGGDRVPPSTNYNSGTGGTYYQGGSSVNTYSSGGVPTGSSGGSFGGSGSSGSYYSPSSGGSPGSGRYEATGGAGGSGGAYIGGGIQPFDPSNRMKLSLSVLFTITEKTVNDEDSSEPSAWKEYMAQSSSETCKTTGPGCSDEWWYVKFFAQDKFTGLSLVQVDKEMEGGRPDYPGSSSMGGTSSGVYYKYQEFPVGTQGTVEVLAGATCCVEKLKLRVTDVAGNQATRDAFRSEYGSGGGLSKTAMWGIIGACIAVVVIIIIVVVSLMTTKYRRVSTNPS